jgi:hypothetical protein
MSGNDIRGQALDFAIRAASIVGLAKTADELAEDAEVFRKFLLGTTA